MKSLSATIFYIRYMESKTKLEIEISAGIRDLDILKHIDPGDIEDLSLIVFKPVSLKFLRQFGNLKRLMIAGSIKDYTPVSDCLSLQELHLSGGTIDNLEFISRLSIKTLTLEGNKSRVSQLLIPNITTLENISLSEVPWITDLSFLSNFTGLKSISLFALQPTRLFDFSKLTVLKNLFLTNMFHLSDLSALKSVSQMDLLYVHQFFINRKIKTDVKMVLQKVLNELASIKEIRLRINDEQYTRFTDNTLVKM